MKNLISLLFCLFLAIAVSGQADSSDVLVDEPEEEIVALNLFEKVSQLDGRGEVIILQDDRLEKLVLKHIEANGKRKGFMGWRVQIYFGSGQNARTEAERIMEEFAEKHPDITPYLDYKRPYFKVMVGDFRTKNEALRLKNKVKHKYRNTWIIEQLINFPKLDYASE